MLRKVYIIKDNFTYERNFGKVLNDVKIPDLFSDIKNGAFSRLGEEIGFFDYYNYRIAFIEEKDLGLILIFVAEFTDIRNLIKTELIKLRKNFLNLFSDFINEDLDDSLIEIINPYLDAIHRNLKPKISVIGFSGVGKTTITNLIKAHEIPISHLPTINGEVGTIKIGKLYFSVWDFAGQDNFNFLWNNFIRGSDIVLLISDSTLKNIENNKLILELIKEEAPYARSAIIANKQDLPNALKVETIERMMGLKTYSIIANDPKNRDKMIRIISDILELSIETSPLLKPLFERDQLIIDIQVALEHEDFKQAAILFEKIANICIEIGDDFLGNEFFKKSEKLNNFLNCAGI